MNKAENQSPEHCQSVMNKAENQSPELIEDEHDSPSMRKLTSNQDVKTEDDSGPVKGRLRWGELLTALKYLSMGALFGLLMGLILAAYLFAQFPSLRRFLSGQEVTMQQITASEQPFFWNWLFVPIMSTLWYVYKTVFSLLPPWVVKKIAEHTSMSILSDRALKWLTAQTFFKPIKKWAWGCAKNLFLTVLLWVIGFQSAQEICIHIGL